MRLQAVVLCSQGASRASPVDASVSHKQREPRGSCCSAAPLAHAPWGSVYRC